MMRLALTAKAATEVGRRSRAAAPKEIGAFFLVRAATTRSGIRFVASEPYFPDPGEYEVHGAHQLRLSARLLSAMISRAENAGTGLLFVHTHPDPQHPTTFSPVDRKALRGFAIVLPDLLDGPLLAAVVGPDGWIAEACIDGAWTPIDRVTMAGRHSAILNPLERSSVEPFDDRQGRALGSINDQLRSLDVAVIGCGGLGSPLMEVLYRNGVRRLLVVDPERLDHPSNVRRVFGSRITDLQRDPPTAKVDAVGRLCREIGLDVDVECLQGDVRHEEVLRVVLDTDIVFCTTDSHSSRAVLDAAAYAYNLPLIDGGVRAGQRRESLLAGLVAEVRICAPGTPCLWCRGTLSAERIREENLPADQRRELGEQGYLIGSPEPQPSVAGLTVMGAGAMSCALLGMLQEDATVLPDAYMFDGHLGDAPRIPPAGTRATCLCRRRTGLADEAHIGMIPSTAMPPELSISKGARA